MILVLEELMVYQVIKKQAQIDCQVGRTGEL